MRRALKENRKSHTKVEVAVTDSGITLGNRVFPAENLLRLLPGVLSVKSGKTYNVAILFERCEEEHHARYHVLQLASRDDGRLLGRAARNMFKTARNNFFRELLDVTTEEGQEGFDSFTIERDIELANERCAQLLQQQAEGAEAQLERLLGAIPQSPAAVGNYCGASLDSPSCW